jgi:hydroxypyruvate reductase
MDRKAGVKGGEILRADAEAIFRAAVARVDPAPMIERALRLEAGPSGPELVAEGGAEVARYALSDYDRVFAAGMGKASARMAAGLERALGGRLAGGLVAVKEGHVEALAKIRLLEAGHPVPDARSRAAAAALLDLGGSLGTRLGPRDLVVVLVSGGGSAILCAPAEGLGLEDKAATTRLLLGSGATINEVNCVRKHLSAVKGGRLAAALSPATVLTLVLSDVIGDDLDAIASGPTVPDPTSYADALAIVRRHGIEERLPPPVAARLRAGAAGGEGAPPETPKPGDPVFARTRTLLVGTNRLALAAAAEEAERRGYRSLVLTSRLTGEAREIAQLFLGMGKDIAASGLPLAAPACVISGGETTVSIRGKGRGGRNQEMALAFLVGLERSPKESEGLCFLSGGTDGNDGPTDAAGAVADLALARSARVAGLDPEAFLADNDSWTFFDRAGGHVKTGPTNTNVCDVQVLLVPEATKM